jgi:hypothetical protein
MERNHEKKSLLYQRRYYRSHLNFVVFTPITGRDRNSRLATGRFSIRQAQALLNNSRSNSPDATREKGPISDFPTRSAVLRQVKN